MSLNDIDENILDAIENNGQEMEFNLLLDENNLPKFGDYIITGPIASNTYGKVYNGRKIGYLTQIRISMGAFGTSIFLLREQDGSLSSHENQCVFVISGHLRELVKSAFDKDVNPDLEIKSNPLLQYTIAGENKASGFIVGCDFQS